MRYIYGFVFLFISSLPFQNLYSQPTVPSECGEDSVELGEVLKAAEEPVWLDNIESAKKSAAKSDKKILIFATAPWCSACQSLKSSQLTDKNLKKLSEKFILVKLVEPEKSIMTKYSIKGFPSLVFADSHGAPYASKVGFDRAETEAVFLDNLNSAEEEGVKFVKFYNEKFTALNEIRELNSKKDWEASIGVIDKSLKSMEAYYKQEGLTDKQKAEIILYVQKLKFFKGLSYMDLSKQKEGGEATQLSFEANKTLEESYKMAPESSIGKKLKRFLKIK
jgi:thiol-disulfide isomerase/thioredoxin